MKNEENISLKEIIENVKNITLFLVSKWIFVLLFSITGSIIGIAFSLMSKPTYKSTLTFIVEGKSGGGGLSNLINNIGLGANNGNQGIFTPENILELIKSRTLINKALFYPLPLNKEKSFADLYCEVNNMSLEDKKNKILNFKPNSDSKHLSLAQNKLLEEIHKKLVDEEIKIEMKNPDNSIITLELVTNNEQFSRYYPEILMSVISEYYIESTTKKAKMNYEVLKKQTDSVRMELNNAISGVAASHDNTFSLNPAFNIKKAPTTHKEVNVQANTAILGELVKNLELARMNILNETPILEIIDTPVSPLKKNTFRKSKGILYGGIGAGIFAVFFLLLRNYYNSIMKTDDHE